MALNSAELTSVADLEKRLATEYPELAPDQVETAVRKAHARFEQSKIRDFVPLFVERRARIELAKSGPLVSPDAVRAFG